MKKLGIVIVAVLATVCVLAQDKPRRAGKHQRGERAAMGERPMRGPGPMMHQVPGAWVPRMLSNKANLEKIGVTDEAQGKKIVAELKRNFNEEFRLVATGGFAKWVLKDLDLPFVVDPTLTLYGTGLVCAT